MQNFLRINVRYTPVTILRFKILFFFSMQVDLWHKCILEPIFYHSFNPSSLSICVLIQAISLTPRNWHEKWMHNITNHKHKNILHMPKMTNHASHQNNQLKSVHTSKEDWNRDIRLRNWCLLDFMIVEIICGFLSMNASVFWAKSKSTSPSILLSVVNWVHLFSISTATSTKGYVVN